MRKRQRTSNKKAHKNPVPVPDEVIRFLGNVITEDRTYSLVSNIEGFPQGFAKCDEIAHRETILVGTRFVGPEFFQDPTLPKLYSMIYFQKTYRACSHNGTNHLNADVYVYWTAGNGSCYRACPGMSPDHYQCLLDATGTTAIGTWLSSSAPSSGSLEGAGFSLPIRLTPLGPTCDY